MPHAGAETLKAQMNLDFLQANFCPRGIKSRPQVVFQSFFFKGGLNVLMVRSGLKRADFLPKRTTSGLRTDLRPEIAILGLRRVEL